MRMRTTVDHLVWGVPDLDEGILEAARLFEALPAAGGSHTGRGTRNALLGLANGQYLELLAPDPAQLPAAPQAAGLAERLADLSGPALVTWAVSTSDLAAVARHLEAAGLSTRGPVRMQRQTPAGERLEWDLLFAGGHDFGSLFPFFIDWRGSPHPSRDLPSAGALEALELQSPHAASLRRLLGNIDVPLVVLEAEEPALQATFETRRGRVVLESVPATIGMRFG
jgi:hypothetical protein